MWNFCEEKKDRDEGDTDANMRKRAIPKMYVESFYESLGDLKLNLSGDKSLYFLGSTGHHQHWPLRAIKLSKCRSPMPRM